MKILKTVDLDRCMKAVIKNCVNVNEIWSEESLYEFCENHKNSNALRVLAKEEYIKIITDYQDNICFVILLEKGISYFAIKSQKRKEFIFKSVVVPIIVSAITTLITIGLKKLFSSTDTNTAMLLSSSLQHLILLI